MKKEWKNDRKTRIFEERKFLCLIERHEKMEKACLSPISRLNGFFVYFEIFFFKPDFFCGFHCGCLGYIYISPLKVTDLHSICVYQVIDFSFIMQQFKKHTQNMRRNDWRPHIFLSYRKVKCPLRVTFQVICFAKDEFMHES